MSTDSPTDRIRVRRRIGALVKGFILAHAGQTFRLAELTAHVQKHEPNCAPGSPDRILRALRQTGEIRYELVNRSQSLYRVPHTPSNPVQQVML
jgi:hypothetical protein